MDVASPMYLHIINCVFTQKVRVLRDLHQYLCKSSRCGFKERCGCFEGTETFLCIPVRGQVARTEFLRMSKCSKPACEGEVQVCTHVCVCRLWSTCVCGKKQTQGCLCLSRFLHARVQ